MRTQHILKKTQKDDSLKKVQLSKEDISTSFVETIADQLNNIGSMKQNDRITAIAETLELIKAIHDYYGIFIDDTVKRCESLRKQHGEYALVALEKEEACATQLIGTQDGKS